MQGDAGDADLIPRLGDPLEEGMATHSSILAWRIPWTEEPGGLQSIRSQRVGHDWSNWACIHIYWASSFLNWGGTFREGRQSSWIWNLLVFRFSWSCCQYFLWIGQKQRQQKFWNLQDILISPSVNCLLERKVGKWAFKCHELGHSPQGCVHKYRQQHGVTASSVGDKSVSTDV